MAEHQKDVSAIHASQLKLVPRSKLGGFAAAKTGENAQRVRLSGSRAVPYSANSDSSLQRKVSFPHDGFGEESYRVFAVLPKSLI